MSEETSQGNRTFEPGDLVEFIDPNIGMKLPEFRIGLCLEREPIFVHLFGERIYIFWPHARNPKTMLHYAHRIRRLE